MNTEQKIKLYEQVLQNIVSEWEINKAHASGEAFHVCAEMARSVLAQCQQPDPVSSITLQEREQMAHRDAHPIDACGGPIDTHSHPNGAPMFDETGMMLDQNGSRSIFDDVDACGGYDDTRFCPRCGAPMRPGIAMGQTVTGSPDFGTEPGCTLSPGGPGEIIQCMKCMACGHSITTN